MILLHMRQYGSVLGVTAFCSVGSNILYHITSLLEKFIGYREEYIRRLYYYFVFMFSMHVFMFVNVFFVYVINEYY